MIQKIQKNKNYIVISNTKKMYRKDAEEFLKASKFNFIKLCNDSHSNDSHTTMKIMYNKGNRGIHITTVHGRTETENDVLQSIQNGTSEYTGNSSLVSDTWFEEFRPDNHTSSARYIKKLCTFPIDAPLVSSLLEIK